jgi:cobyrinic acid a,c-diamide synthase
MIPRIVIAAPSSSSGKTTVTLAIMAALSRRGMRVAPFKVGPDYIDPQLHARASGRISYNLDRYFVGEAGIRKTLERGSHDADIAVIEGVMGLFDGASPHNNEGSGADIALLLDAPVILVVDASGMARSVGALVRGFRTFEPRLNLAGVIMNRLGSRGHHDYLRPALLDEGVADLGFFPRNAEISLPERHLGLLPAAESDLVTPILDRLAAMAEETVDLDKLVAIAGSENAGDGIPQLQLGYTVTGISTVTEPYARVRIGWAEDEVFHFSYQENKNLLEEAGAEIVPFSPLHDTAIPDGVDALWLGGGFPEQFAARLGANRSMRESIFAFAKMRGTIYAECGGLMYLCEWFEEKDSSRLPLVGLIPGGTRMTDRLQRFGYGEATFLRDTPLGPAGTVLRGHRFHYSEYLSPTPEEAVAVYSIRKANGSQEHREGILTDNVLATYFHVHLGNRPESARHFVDFVRHARTRSVSS